MDQGTLMWVSGFLVCVLVLRLGVMSSSDKETCSPKVLLAFDLVTSFSPP